MFNPLYYQVIAWSLLGFAPVVLLALLFRPAAYGRYAKFIRFGLPKSIGWVVMEIPSVVFFIVVFFSGPRCFEWVPLLLMGLFQLHYIHRALIFPFQLVGSKNQREPWSIIAMSFVFNMLNSYMIASYLSSAQSHYTDAWLQDPRFISGLLLFFVGYYINRHADYTLISLRKRHPSVYSIPRAGLYRIVSCPNYLGEMMIWAGFALASWCLGSLTFLVFTIANLLPRAVSHHRWYQQKFPDYPKERWALIPGVL